MSESTAQATRTKRVLLIGQVPETVDFSDPSLPPGLDAAKVHAGIDLGLQSMAQRGWHADLCLVRPDDSAADDVERQLRQADYDCVVIGAGLRLPPKSMLLFEQLVNAVHRAAPKAAMAFNTSPPDTADAAARWI